MITTKIKYKGEWRNVLGLSLVDGQVCYKAQCNDNKRTYNTISMYDKDITDKIESNAKRYPSSKLKINDLKQWEKDSIIRMYYSGKFYMAEICRMHWVTPHTVRKLADELRTKTNKM